MAEYSKFVAPDFAPIDWGKITGDIVSKLDKTEKEREDKRVALDKEYTDVVKKIDSFQGSRAPTFNQFIMKSVDKLRNHLYEQNRLLKQGMITPSEYSSRVSTISDGWSRLADSAKTNDQEFERGMKRVNDGTASGQEIYLRQKKSEMLNLKGKEIFISPNDSRIFIAETNKDGGVNSDSNLIDIQTFNAGLNQDIDKLILSTEVEKYTKTLGKEARMVNGRYVASQEIRRGFESKAKPKIIASIMSDPNKAASVLKDNSEEDYTFEDDKLFFTSREENIEALSKLKKETTDEKKKKEIQSEINRIDNELKHTIFLERDENYIYTPVLSEYQKGKAEGVIGDIVKSQLDYITEKPESVGGMSYSESRDMQKDAKEAEKANKRVREVKAITNPSAKPSLKSDIINQLADNTFPEFKGYVVTNFNYNNGKYIFDLRKPLFDKAGKPLRKKNGDREYDYHVVVKNPGEDVNNAVNSFLNQKRGTGYAWHDISPELAAAPTGNIGLNATAILNKNK